MNSTFTRRIERH